MARLHELMRETGRVQVLLNARAGRLVLFPSYMWHGTVPFSSADPRLTCAFDIVRR